MLTLLTATSFRPEFFSLVEKYVANQTYVKNGKPCQWIVACDGDISKYQFTMGQKVIVNKPHSHLHSICSNYRVLIEEAIKLNAEKVLFIEDDDWIHPTFFEVYDKWLDHHDLVGIAHNRYYHIKNQAYCEMPNRETSSLASTGVSGKTLPFVRALCFDNDPYIDIALWKKWEPAFGTKKLRSYKYNHLHVGIKDGMGYGHGHALCEPKDEDGKILREWLGEDAKNYTTLQA